MAFSKILVGLRCSCPPLLKGKIKENAKCTDDKNTYCHLFLIHRLIVHERTSFLPMPCGNCATGHSGYAPPSPKS